MAEPSSPGAVQVTAADWLPAVAATPVGASGTVETGTEVDPSDVA